MSSVEKYFYTHLYILCTSVIVVMNVNANLMLFILQVQPSSSVEAALQSAVEIPFTEATERIKDARRVRGHSVMSFTIPRSCVSHIRVSELHHTALHTLQLSQCHVLHIPLSLLTSSLPCISVSKGISLALPTVQRLQFLPCIHKVFCPPCQDVVSSCVASSLFLPASTFTPGWRCGGQPWTYPR